MSKYKWFGNDASNECSLFDQGLLLRRKSRGVYDAIVYVGSGYQFGSFWFDGIVAEMDEDKAEWDNIGSMVGMSGEEYRKHIVDDLGGDSGAVELAMDRIGYYGIDDTIGISAYAGIYTENEVKIRLNKAPAA